MPTSLDDYGDVDLLRETAFVPRGGEALDSSFFDGEPPSRYDPEGEQAWEYWSTFDPETGLYCLEITRWTHYVDIPATLHEPAEVGWEGSAWEDLTSAEYWPRCSKSQSGRTCPFCSSSAGYKTALGAAIAAF